jgi:hypothetical protein
MQVDYQGRKVEAEEVDFKTAKEDFNEYQLFDGTLLKLKSVVTRILKLTGEKAPDGSSIYNISSQPVFVVLKSK